MDGRGPVTPGMSPPPPDWYRGVAAHLGEAYLAYGFAQGTEQEVDFLWEHLALQPGHRVLDVGCGPGRHCIELARRGIDAIGIDIAPEFIALARQGAADAGAAASFFEMDARSIPFDSEFDAAISICEGAFGLGFDDLGVLRSMARSLRPGGMAAAGAANVFHLLGQGDGRGELDPVLMLWREVREGVIGGGGDVRSLEMWASCFTPRELSWIANGAGLEPVAVFGIEPGAYRAEPPSKDHPELLLVARRPPHAAPRPSR